MENKVEQVGIVDKQKPVVEVSKQQDRRSMAFIKMYALAITIICVALIYFFVIKAGYLG